MEEAREFVLDALARGDAYYMAYENLRETSEASSWEVGHQALEWYSAAMEVAAIYLGWVGKWNSALRNHITEHPERRAQFYRDAAAAGFSFDQEAYKSLVPPFETPGFHH